MNNFHKFCILKYLITNFTFVISGTIILDTHLSQNTSDAFQLRHSLAPTYFNSDVIQLRQILATTLFSSDIIQFRQILAPTRFSFDTLYSDRFQFRHILFFRHSLVLTHLSISRQTQGDRRHMSPADKLRETGEACILRTTLGDKEDSNLLIIQLGCYSLYKKA